jgi:hypothetical protein
MKRLNVVEPRHSLADILNRAEYQGERIMIGQVPPHPDHFCATTSRSVRYNLD